MVALLATASRLAWADPPQPPPPDPRITSRHVIDGWTGLPIPCRCLYQGKDFKLGDTVCMATHVGVVMTRCELFLNNTAWMPTSAPCTIARSPGGTLASPRETSTEAAAAALVTP